MDLRDKIVKLAEEINEKSISVGVVGYSSDLTLGQMDFALKKLRHHFADLDVPHKIKEVVSGYTNLGVPAIAYEVATEMGFKTVGIACEKCHEYDTYPVSEHKIVGENWGDESDEFLKRIDVLIRIGGGDQSFKEVEMFKKKDGFEPTMLIEHNM